MSHVGEVGYRVKGRTITVEGLNEGTVTSRLLAGWCPRNPATRGSKISGIDSCGAFLRDCSTKMWPTEPARCHQVLSRVWLKPESWVLGLEFCPAVCGERITPPPVTRGLCSHLLTQGYRRLRTFFSRFEDRWLRRAQNQTSCC